MFRSRSKPSKPPASPKPPSSRTNRKKRPRKTRRRDDVEEEYFSLKSPGILAERRNNGRVEYLCDWQDNPVTGEVYQPTWEPHNFVTLDQVAIWQQRVLESSQSQSATTQASNPYSAPDSSSPIRPAKRRRITKTRPPTSEEDTPLQANLYTRESARFQTAPQEQEGQARKEVPDSYEEGLNSPRDKEEKLRVEIPDLNIDQTSYQTVASSQSQAQSSPQATLNSSPARASILRDPHTRKSYIWDEDIGVIPDSQELPGSSSYKESGPSSAKPGSLTQNTATTSELAIGAIQVTSSHTASSKDSSEFVDSQLAEPPSQFAEASFNPETLEVSTQSRSRQSSANSARIGRYAGSVSLEPVVGESSSSPATPSVGSAVASRALQPALRPVRSSQEIVSDFPDTQTPAGIPKSDQEYQIESNNLPVPPSSPLQESPSSEFQSQAPESPVFKSGSQLQGDQLRFRVRASRRQHQALQADFDRRQPPLPTERAGSEINTTTVAFTSAKERTPTDSSQKTSQEISSQASNLPTPPSEKLVFSIERTEDGNPITPPPGQRVRSSTDSQQPISSPASAFRMEGNTPDAAGGERAGHYDVFASLSQKMATAKAEATSRRKAARAAASSSMSPSTTRESSIHNPDLIQYPVPEPSISPSKSLSNVSELIALIPPASASSMADRTMVAPSLPAHASDFNRTAVAVNQMLPRQDLTTKAHSSSSDYEGDNEGVKLSILAQEYEEYLVALPMVANTRSIYDTHLEDHDKQRSRFINQEFFEASLVQEIDTMMGELVDLCDHPDLIQDDFGTQQEDTNEVQAKWAVTASTKCIFLAELLTPLKNCNTHIIILVRPGRMFEILEALLSYNGLVYRRADRPNWCSDHSRSEMLLRITLFPTSGQTYNILPPTAVIAFDSTARGASMPISRVETIRNNPNLVGKQAPLISLVVQQSIEHLERCFSRDVDPTQRKIKIVSCLGQLRDEFGKLDQGYKDPPDAAKSVAEYLLNGAVEGSWPLQSMPDIQGLDLDVSQPGSRIDDPVLNLSPMTADTAISHHIQTQLSISQVFQSSGKRQLDADHMMIEDSPKRQRMSPVVDEVATNDVFQISDTSRQPLSEIPNSTYSDGEAIGSSAAVVDQNKEDLLRKIKDLEGRLKDKDNKTFEILSINADLEVRCGDYETSLSNIQKAYQQALDERGATAYELDKVQDETMERVALIQKKLERIEVELSKMKVQKEKFEVELIAARQALATSAVPEIAEMEAMRLQVERINAHNVALQKKIDVMEGNFEFMRTNYQMASSSAAEANREISNVTAEVNSLRLKAADNIVQIHRIQGQSEIAELIKELDDTKAGKEQLERELEKKDDELRALKNGRRATRGTSVPMSPRMGMSPGPKVHMRQQIMQNVQMGGSGNRSRGNSPAPGDIRTFGDALLPGGQTQSPAQGSSRWANHLQ